MSDTDDLLDIGEAARFLSVSETSLRRWTNAGVLRCRRVGRRRERRFRREDLLAFMEQPESRNEVVDVPRGSHMCGIYGSDTGLISLCVPFILEGLREGSTCLLVAPLSSRKEILMRLKDLRPTLASDIEDGRLVLTEHRSSGNAMRRHLTAQLNKAKKAGASSFRMLGDMIAMRAKVSSDELIKFEAGVDDSIIAHFPVTALCVYDARKFSGVDLLNALKAHRDSFRFPLGPSLA